MYTFIHQSTGTKKNHTQHIPETDLIQIGEQPEEARVFHEKNKKNEHSFLLIAIATNQIVCVRASVIVYVCVCMVCKCV